MLLRSKHEGCNRNRSIEWKSGHPFHLCAEVLLEQRRWSTAFQGSLEPDVRTSCTRRGLPAIRWRSIGVDGEILVRAAVCRRGCVAQPCKLYMTMRSRWTLLRHGCCLLVCVVAVAWTSLAAAAKIACVGDSITYGYGLSNPSQQSYPAVLQTLVGSTHTVRNFGTSGCTLLKNGDKPYWNDANFAASDAFKPDVVVIMLGTNDAKPQNWSHEAEFAGDYASLIDHYRGLGALVYVATPPPVYPPGAFDIDPDVLSGEIVPLIRRAGTDAGAPLIEVFQALGGKANLFPDTVHPNAEGAQLIAQTVAAGLQAGGFGGAAGVTGGISGSGGSARGTGGVSGSGGLPSGTGGASGSGGSPGTGGAFQATGGISGNGGSAQGAGGSSTGTGGASAGVGGSSRGSGGSAAGRGGASVSGGGPGAGGAATGSGGVVGSGGAPGSGGAQGGQSGSGGPGGSGSGRGGEAGSAGPASGGSVGGSGGSAVQRTENAGGCGCHVLGGEPVQGSACLVALLLLATLRRRRRDSPIRIVHEA
jgi:acyl-CoA thioesterase-1